MTQYFTLNDIANATGVRKPTVVRRAKELGIYDQLKVVDGRGKLALTAEQASILTDALSKANPEGLASIKNENERYEVEQINSTMIEQLNQMITNQQSLIETQKLTIEQLQRTIENLSESRDGELERLHERIKSLEIQLKQSQACVQELAACHWWEKRGIVTRYALPAPAEQAVVEIIE